MMVDIVILEEENNSSPVSPPALKPKTSQLKQTVIASTKVVYGGISGCSGFAYIGPAYYLGSKISGSHLIGGLAATATFIAVSSYTGYGGIKCVDRIAPERIQAFVSENEIECYNQFVYPCAIIIMGYSSLLPIVSFSYLVNENLFLGLLPLLTDPGLRIISLDNSFREMQLSRKFLNLFRTTAQNPHPEILATFLQQLNLGANCYLQDLSKSTLLELLTQEIVIRNSDGSLSFISEWKIILKELLNKTLPLQSKRQKIFLLNRFFSIYLMKLGGSISALSIIAIELYLSYLAGGTIGLYLSYLTGGAITFNFYIETGIALGAVGPIMNLQYSFITGVWMSFYDGLISKIFGVSAPSWLDSIHPVLSKVRTAGATLIATCSWMHILALIDDLFPETGILRILALTLVIPSNCVLLLAGMLELSELLHIYLMSKSNDHSEMAKIHYKINLLICEIKYANPDTKSMMALTQEIKDLLEENSINQSHEISIELENIEPAEEELPEENSIVSFLSNEETYLLTKPTAKIKKYETFPNKRNYSCLFFHLPERLTNNPKENVAPPVNTQKRRCYWSLPSCTLL